MSKRKLQKVFGLILSAAMLSGCLVGCGSQEEQKSSQSSQVQESQKSSEVQKSSETVSSSAEEMPEEITYPLDTDISLRWWSQADIKYQSAFNSAEESPFHIGLSENTGVDITWEFPQDGVSASQAYSLMMTEDVKDLPHMIHYWPTQAEGDELINSEIIWDLTEYIPLYAPDYWEYINSDPMLKESVMTTSGKLYWFCCSVENEFNIVYQGLAIRKDWLDECGLSVPVTAEDWENVLIKFKEKYGAVYSGPKGSFGMGSATGAFSDTSARWYVDNDKVLLANNTEEYKAFLELMNHWYEEGLIDQDIFTNDNATIRSKCANNEVGAMFIASSAFRNILTDAEETGAEWIGVPYAISAPGEKVTYMPTSKSNMGVKGTMITKACSEEELIVALKLLNYAYTDEGFMYWNFGNEGVSYTLDANGNVQWTDLITKSEVGANTAYKYYQSSGPIIQAAELVRVLNQGTSYEALEAWISNSVAREYIMPTVSLTADENLAYTDTWTAIQTYVEESIDGFILGDISFDKWDDYVTTLDKMGLKECQKIQQAAYERWCDRVGR